MLELGLYRSTRYPAWQEPLIVVVGNRFEDFCLYYCLSRLRDRVVWSLPSITNRAIDGEVNNAMSRVEMHFSFGLRSAAKWNQSQRGIACLTYSLTRMVFSFASRECRVNGFSISATPGFVAPYLAISSGA